MSETTRGGGIGDIFNGAGCLVRGVATLAGSPHLWLLGLVPALLALVVVVALLVGLAVALPGVVNSLTPFAAAWGSTERGTLRLLIGAAVIVAAIWLALVSYTALAVAIGQPFYELIVRRVEARDGLVPAQIDVPWWRAAGRAVRDGIFMVALTAGLSLTVLVLGLLPVVGQTLVPVAAACITAFLLAVELSAIALERRGVRLRERVRLLWRRRFMAIGFGLAVLLLFLVPLGVVLVMPAAVVGGSYLARRLTA